MKRFARWRVKVWDDRLGKYRAAWNRATLEDNQALEQLWETVVTKALVKRTKWRKRAGVRR